MRAPWIWGILLLALTGARAQVTPLTLPYCLDAAAQHNRQLLQARERIAQVKGDRIRVRSRFLPHLDLTAQYSADDTRIDWHPGQDQSGAQVRLAQRLFEFGPDAAQDIQLREDLRQALYAYQEQVYTLLAGVWEVFHLILLQEQQIVARRLSRDGFQATFAQQEARYQRRLSTEEEKLSAELNVLNEELAINNLERQQFRNKMELLRLIGQPLGIQLQLQGELSSFAVDQEEAVRLALENDVEIRVLAELLKEQQRLTREVYWEYSPDLSLEAGLDKGRRHAQFSLDKEGRTWGLNLGSQYRLREEGLPPSLAPDRRWFAQVEARLPLFEGGATLGRRAREKARLRQVELQFHDARAAVELEVRQAYQAMLEAAQQQQIQQQRVAIARRRLEINQILKDKGQADESLLEQVRTQFFEAQTDLFANQETYIRRQAALRRLMGYMQ